MLKKLKIILKMSFPMKVLKIKNNKVLVQMAGIRPDQKHHFFIINFKKKL